jgi:hypothetical protein
MPPAAVKMSEQDRLHVSTWIQTRLRQTACNAGDFAGGVALLGVDFAVADFFPADGSGGEGFGTNSETLYLPPMMLELYVEAAQQIRDRAIIPPPMQKTISSAQLEPAVPGNKPVHVLQPGEEVSGVFPLYLDGDYNLRVSLERPRKQDFEVELKVDGLPAGTLK